MANVVRQDIVQIGFEVDDNPIQKLAQEINKITKALSGLEGADPFAEMGEMAEKASELLDKVKESAKGIAGAGFSGIQSMLSKGGMNPGGGKLLAGGIDALFKGGSETVQQYADDYLSAISGFSTELAQSLGGLFQSSGTSKGTEMGPEGLLGNIANMKTGTVLKAMANISIVVSGMGALLWAASKVFQGGGDYSALFDVTELIGKLGNVGAELSKLSKTVGKIPVTTVLKGLLNMAAMVVGMGVLLFLASKVFANGVPFQQMSELVVLLGLLGSVGSVLSVFAGIIGMIPISAVLLGLTNIALVLGGLSAIVLAFAALGEIPGFNEFISRGGDVLANLFQQLGKIVGSLIGGIGEGVTNSLPQIGENLSAFAQSLAPMFSTFNGVDMGGLGSFFSSFGSFMLKLAGEKVLSFFTGGTNLSEVGTQLDGFAHSAQSAFICFSEYPDSGIEKAPKILEAIKGIGRYEFKSGGLAQLITGGTDLSGVGTQLDGFAHSAQSAFNCFSEYPESGIEKAPRILEAIDGIGKYEYKSGGLAQLITGGTDLSELGRQLDGFAHSGQSAFNCFSEYPESGIEKAPRIFNALDAIGRYDYKSGGLAQLITGGVNLSDIGWQLDGFAHMAQSAFNCFSEYPESGIEKAQRIFAVMGSIGNFGLMFGAFISSGWLANTGIQLDLFAHSAQSAFNCFSEFPESGFANLNSVILSLVNLSVAISTIVLPSILGINGVLMMMVTMLAASAAGFTFFGAAAAASSIVAATAFMSLCLIVSLQMTMLVYMVRLKGFEAVWAVKSMMDGIRQAVVTAADLYQAGADMVQGLINGIWSKREAAVAAARALATAINLEFDKIQQIGSPSKVWYRKGQYLGEGEIGGMRSMIPSVQNAAMELGTASAPSYTPENSAVSSKTVSTEHNTYAPQFMLNISGTANDRAMARKVKVWIKEALDDTFDSIGRKQPRTQQV